MSDIDVSIAVLALIRAKKLGPAGARDLLLKLDYASALGAPVEAVLDAAGVTRAEVNASFSGASSDIKRGLEIGVFPVPLSSLDYPVPLRKITDAPPILFARGELSVLSRMPGIAVVGTRKATRHGLTIAHRLSSHVSRQGWAVVSGLALGIDAAAHEGALEGGSPTVAVLAHGLEKPSPRANEPLAMRILESGGIWVSEHPIGTTAKPEYFVQRNRIQVGLSAASVIVEGATQSGSMTQAEYCMRYRRALFAVLPESTSSVNTQSALPRMLVRERGATAIVSMADYPTLIDEATRLSEDLSSWEQG